MYIRQIISEHHQSDTYVNKLGQDITHSHTFNNELMLLAIFFHLHEIKLRQNLTIDIPIVIQSRPTLNRLFLYHTN